MLHSLIFAVKQINQSYRFLQLYLAPLLHRLTSGFFQFGFQVRHSYFETRNVMENTDVLVASGQDEPRS